LTRLFPPCVIGSHTFDQAGADAKQAWQNFYNALLAHEQGHVKVLKDYFTGEGKKALDNFAKKKYWGEAHDRDRAKDLAERPFYKARDAILEEHRRLQEEYDKITDHGRNQQVVGGQNVVPPDPHIPCD